MPIEPRPIDTFTRENLLLGLPIVDFTPRLAGGGFGPVVPLGIISSAELGKEVDLLNLERGDAGLLVVDREFISRFSAAFNLETFNFRADVARFAFASSTAPAVVADAAAVVASDPVTLPDPGPFDSFLGLSRARLNEASVEVTIPEIEDELVGTGTGSANDFSLAFKVKAVGDVSSVTVGGVAYTPVAVGAAAAGNEVEVTVGESDAAHPTGSGSLLFHVGGVATDPPLGAAIVATYQPSFSTTGTDIEPLVDFVLDPLLGRVRFLFAGANASPFRPAGGGQPISLAYTYQRFAHTVLAPFTQNVFEGKALIRQLTDVGANFRWEVPSASLRITDDSLTFNAEDFATAALVLNILNAGGSAPYGTIELSSEPESS